MFLIDVKPEFQDLGQGAADSLAAGLTDHAWTMKELLTNVRNIRKLLHPRKSI
ncbi:MAG: hypothetical protein ACUVRJ_06495 [Candidatus Villigracilaceae bacterium]